MPCDIRQNVCESSSSQSLVEMTTNSVSHSLAKSVDGIGLSENRLVQRPGFEASLGCFFDRKNDFAHGLPSLMRGRFGCIAD